MDAVSDLGPDILRPFQTRPMAFRCAPLIDLLAHFAKQSLERYQLAQAQLVTICSD